MYRGGGQGEVVGGHGRGCVLGSEGGEEETGAVDDGDGGGIVRHG